MSVVARPTSDPLAGPSPGSPLSGAAGPVRATLISRRTPLSARGEPLLWLMGLSLTLCVAMIVGLLSMIVFQGFTTFWPRPIDKVTLADGGKFLGIPMRDEAFVPGEIESKHLSEIRASASSGAFASDGRPIRRLYRTGNKEIGAPFRWVTLADIKAVERPPLATMLERREWGVWLGEPRSMISIKTVNVSASAGPIVAAETLPSARGDQRVLRKVERTESDGSRVVRESTYLTSDAEQAWGSFQSAHAEAVDRHERIERLTKFDIGSLNRRMDDQRLRVKSAEIEHARTAAPHDAPMLGIAGVLAVTVSVAGAAVGAIALARRRATNPLAGMIAVRSLWCAVALGAVFAALEHPWSGPRMSAERLGAIKADAAEQVTALQARYATVLGAINELREEEGRERVEFVEPSQGSFAPLRQSSPEDPLMIAQVVRAVPANALSFGGKVGVYFSRWREFLFDDPREANTEGGVFPVIFGTVLLTLLLSLVVVPLGVIAALYLREYAKQGPVTSAVRIAVNNLAGVPSIVYGVFGLGFFCYTVGKYVDQGPTEPMGQTSFWLVGAGLAALVAVSLAAALLAKPRPGKPVLTRHRALAAAAGVAWCAAFGVVTVWVSGIPQFHGLFEANLPSPTIGTRGLLWGALTLALMTLPVVIVATEEAIAAVPRTMREGSYGCGASKWQTIRRIVLPGAMPGIMTGMVLAMARGAGEVAPLMLVGAVKLAPELPFSAQFPFIHLERSFMHLGFHIYDLGFQSPDSDAARPLVWTTTLLLIAIVVLLNLAAITIRARLRGRFKSQQF